MAARGGRSKLPTIASQHAEWVGLLRPDGPFIAVSVLAQAFPQGLDTVPDGSVARLRQAWDEVQSEPGLLGPAWQELVLGELLRLTGPAFAEGAALPDELHAWGAGDNRVRPDAVVFGPEGPGGSGGRAERLLVYRRPWDSSLTAATKEHPSAIEQAADLCKRREVGLALLTNGRMWVLVHAKEGEPASVASFDADLWLEERDLLRAFVSLLSAQRVLAPSKLADGAHSDSLTALFARSAEAQAEITDTLGAQVRQAVELLVGELARLDRESGGTLLAPVPERQVYKGCLSLMMRLVFLLFAEEQRLLPVDSELYASAYSVGGLYDLLEDEQARYGEELGDRRAAAWPRLLATFGAVFGGSEHDELRIPPYGGTLFDPARFWWLQEMKVTDRVVHEILDALLILRRRGSGPERLSYKGLDVEQIGHVYEGLLEFSCIRVREPYLGLFGKLEPELPLSEVERAAAEEGNFEAWLKDRCNATPAQISKALAATPTAEKLTDLDAACDNDHGLALRAKPFVGLLRTDLRGRPTVFPKDSLIITQVGDRRATGTHYTPRALAEEIVKHTLAPLCFSPGPADGAEEPSWRAKTAEELLRLKVLDPAMGSGAFLVSACRYLAECVVEAWSRDGMPFDVADAVGPDADRDDLLLEARRRVAARCIYGVDRDDQAVELAKLSLWLVTLAKDKPFSFLDHSLRCGDSLVGLLSEAQVEAFHLDPDRGRVLNARLSGTIDEVTTPLLTRVQKLREEIEAEPIRDAAHGAVLAAKLREAERLADRLRLASDAVVAAALSTAGKSEDLYDERLSGLAADVQQAMVVDQAGEPTFEAELAEKRVLELIIPMLKGPRAEPIRPLHWPLEFPEVMRRGGFNAVVGNPPFLNGQKLTGILGEDLREFLIEHIAGSMRGSADLCSYFMLRNLSLGNRGRVGIIATNTIAQGNTREVGLDQALDKGLVVFRAVKSQRWPGTAALEVALVWIGHAEKLEVKVLEDARVARISSTLDPDSRVTGRPRSIAKNTGESFIGSYVYGTGFIIGEDEYATLVEHDPRNMDVLFPYLIGEDVNSRWDSSASRWVVNFHDWSQDRAREYSGIFEVIERHVKPFRAANKRKVRRERWWLYAERPPGLYDAISDLDYVLVVSRVTKHFAFEFVPAGQVFSERLVVFASSSHSLFSLLTSELHQAWVLKHGATLETRPMYGPSDVYENFVKPRMTTEMEHLGGRLNSSRKAVMRERSLGLTSFYNLVHDDARQDTEIQQLRGIHVEIDEAVREAYALDEEREPGIREFEERIAPEPLPAWRDIDLGHGFHETRQGVRFTISAAAQYDVLDKLLALNHYRYQQEVEQGLHNKKGKGKARKRSGTTESVEPAAQNNEDTLF